MRRLLAILGLSATVAGCGAEDGGIRDRPRPAPPLELSAVVRTDELTVEPSRVPTGRVSATFANLTDRRVEILLGRGGTLASVVVPAHGTAQMTTTLRAPGRYVVATRDGAPRTALVASGTRPSSSNSLNLP